MTEFYSAVEKKSDICRKMDGTWDLCAKENKLNKTQTDRYLIHFCVHVWLEQKVSGDGTGGRRGNGMHVTGRKGNYLAGQKDTIRN